MKIYQFPLSPKTIIFDIDSTLYTCPEYAHEQIDSQIRYFASLRDISAEDARAMVSGYRKKWAQEHNGERISLGNLLLAFGISIEESIEWRKMLFNPYDYLHVDSRLQETLTKLSMGYNLLCITNNPVEPARKTLDALGVASLIPDIIGLDTCFKSKPAREPLERAMEVTGAKAQECISVGDRYDIDLALPLSMGMGGILVKGVEEVYALPDFLEGALS